MRRSEEQVNSDDAVKLLPLELGTFLLGESYQVEQQELEDVNFADVLRTLIRDRKASPSTLEAIYRKHVRPYLLTRASRPSVFVFVDSMDEQFKGVNGTPFIEAVKKGMKLPISLGEEPQSLYQEAAELGYVSSEKSYDLWAFSQNTLIDAAIKLLADSGGRVCLVGTMRSEAYLSSVLIGKSRTQLGNIVKRIVYSKEHLEEIFALNIEQCDKKRLVDTTREDRLIQFFGKIDALHWKVVGEKERIIDAIVRHTLENPRDLMEIGERLYDLSKDERRNRDRAAQEVNVASKVILEEHLAFIGENFDENVKKYCFPLIGTNVLSAADVHQIAEKVTRASGGTLQHPFCYLFRLGLLGIPKQTEHGLIQQFLINSDVAENVTRSKEFLPSATHYLIHPALKQLILEHRGGYGVEQFVTNHQVIVGNGLKWNPQVGVGRVIVAYDKASNRPAISIDGHSMSVAVERPQTFSFFSDRATILFVAILLALEESQAEAASVDSVLEQIEKLAAHRIIANQFKGRIKRHMTAREYFGDHIAESKGHPSIVVRINKVLIANQLGHFSLKVIESRRTVKIQGLHGAEIVVKGFEWHANSFA